MGGKFLPRAALACESRVYSEEAQYEDGIRAARKRARTYLVCPGRKEEWKREVGAQQRTSFFSDVVFCFRNSSPCVTQADIRSDSDCRHATKSALILRSMHVEISKYGNDIASRRLDEISSPQACQALFSILRLLSFPPVTKRNSLGEKQPTKN